MRKEITKVYWSFKRIRKKSNIEAFNTDYFTYLKSSDSLLFTTPLPGSNSSDCSKRSTVIGNQEIS